jgi:hypothetical protein
MLFEVLKGTTFTILTAYAALLALLLLVYVLARIFIVVECLVNLIHLRRTFTNFRLGRITFCILDSGVMGLMPGMRRAAKVQPSTQNRPLETPTQRWSIVD